MADNTVDKLFFERNSLNSINQFAWVKGWIVHLFSNLLAVTVGIGR